MNKIHQAFQASAKWLLFCAILLCNFNLSQAQNDHGSKEEIAVYRAAVQAIFEDSTILAYYYCKHAHRNDFFIVVPPSIKTEIHFGKSRDRLIVDSCGLYKSLRIRNSVHVVAPEVTEIANRNPPQYGVYFVVDGVVKVGDHRLERRLVPGPAISTEEDYFLGFEVIEENNGDIVARHYPLPYIPLTPK